MLSDTDTYIYLYPDYVQGTESNLTVKVEWVWHLARYREAFIAIIKHEHMQCHIIIHNIINVKNIFKPLPCGQVYIVWFGVLTGRAGM